MEGLPNAGLTGTLASGGSLCHKYTRLARAEQITLPRQKPLGVVGLEALPTKRSMGGQSPWAATGLLCCQLPGGDTCISPNGAVAG